MATTKQSRVPISLRSGLVALFAATSIAGGGLYVTNNQAETARLLENQYIQTVAADKEASDAVKVAMVMGSFYESGYKHIGKPYVDRLGKGQPLTVCNGITGKGVFPNKIYTPTECFILEKPRYLKYEEFLKMDTPVVVWNKLTIFQKATFMDFLHNKGEGAYMKSTLRRKLHAGDVVGSCLENEKWNRGTVKGVSTVLPGLKIRADSNSDLCTSGLNQRV